MDFGVGVIVVPIVLGLLGVAVRLGLPPPYEAIFAVALGLAISVGYTMAAGVPGGTTLADAVLRGVAVGLSSAGLYAGIRRTVIDGRA